MSLEPGQSLGPYKVATLLGEGGMSQWFQELTERVPGP